MLSPFPEVPPVIIPSECFPPINLVRKVVSFPELAKIMEERDKGREMLFTKCLVSHDRNHAGGFLHIIISEHFLYAQLGSHFLYILSRHHPAKKLSHTFSHLPFSVTL